MISWFVVGMLAWTILVRTTPAPESTDNPPAWKDIGRATGSPPTLDLRDPMSLGARAMPPQLDPNAGFRPWFMLRGHNGIPAQPRHDLETVEAHAEGIVAEELKRRRWGEEGLSR